MLAVEKWGQGKHPTVAYLAISYALMARTRCEALQTIKERRIFGHQFSLPDLPSWFALYRSTKSIFAYKRLLSHTSDFTDDLIKVFSSFRKLDKFLKNSQKVQFIAPSPLELKEANAAWQGMCSQLYVEIGEEIAQTPPLPEIQKKFAEALIRDELPLAFYFLVYAPCTLLYTVSPFQLYREAIDGDVKSIEKLLKLDPLIIHDPSIGFQIQSFRLKGKINDYETIISAVLKNPTAQYQDMRDERKCIKSNHGASIYFLAKALRKPLRAPQIRELFDAIAQDFDGTLLDTDIISPEGFDATIRSKASALAKKEP